MYDKSILRTDIIRALLDNGALCEREICNAVGASRGTVTAALEELDTVLERVGKGYFLSDRLAVLILRVKREEIGIRAYFSGKGVLEDIALPLSLALTREAATAQSLASLDKYRRAIEGKGYRVICCMIGSAVGARPHSLPDIISAFDHIEELTARALGRSLSGSSVYVADVSFMCVDSKAVTRSVDTPSGLYDFLEGYLCHVLPSRVVIEGKSSESIVELCRKRRVECCFLESADRLYIYEKEMIAAALARI